MSAETTLGFAYPIGTDPVASLDTILQSLAERLDDRVGIHAMGRAVINITALSTHITSTIALPVDLFTVAANIVVVATISTTTPTQFDPIGISNVQLEQFDMTVRRNAGSTGNVTFHWHAAQVAP